MSRGHGDKLDRLQEQALVALLEKPTIGEAAAAVGVNEKTLRAWLKDPTFAAAYRQTRRELVETAVGRIQAATGTAVDTLLAVAKSGAKDSDRVRAAVALLDHAFRALTDADVLDGERGAGTPSPMGTADVVQVLAARLRQVDQAELPTAEKSRLTATLADALLRAIGVDVLDKRLEALQAVLIGRKEEKTKWTQTPWPGTTAA
jgi:hypothetical protein